MAAFFAGPAFVAAGLVEGAFFMATFFAATFFAAAFFTGGFLAGAFFTDAFWAGAFFADAFWPAATPLAGALGNRAGFLAAAFLGAGPFFGTVLVPGVAFFADAARLVVPLVAPDEPAERRDTALRAAEAALPASDRVVLRAMGSLRGLGRENWDEAITRESRATEGIAPGGSAQSRRA